MDYEAVWAGLVLLGMAAVTALGWRWMGLVEKRLTTSPLDSRLGRFESVVERLIERVGQFVQQGPRQQLWGVVLFGSSVSKTGVVPVFYSKSGFSELGRVHEVVFKIERPVVVGGLLTAQGAALVTQVRVGSEVYHDEPLPALVLRIPLGENTLVTVQVKTWA